ncbi:MAG: glycoside hydrolase family 127 protein, partial [Clostridia bacterium]|nr:glycoside hydrolase family 127 protein [Clostridia bacterium]
PEERWTDMGKHEAYCIGHMLEAGVAYFYATGERKLLDVCIRAAKHMEDIFGPEKRIWVVGHQELELALVKLYRVTGDRAHLEFADWLLSLRGHGHTEGHSCDFPVHGLSLMQDDIPLTEVQRVTGHAVRMMYYMAGAADVSAEAGKQEYADAALRVWDNVCNKNMYVTGGIGPNRKNEGFLDDYFLPIDDNYCETCAQIGMTYFNHRLNLMSGQAKYADIVELELYNGVLSGIAYDGKHFYYANPMQSEGDKPRSEWFRCSCCPSNLCRFIPSVGEYFYAVAAGTLYVNQFASGTATVTVDGEPVRVTQKTAYPYDGRVELAFVSAKPVTVKLRMPGWCRSAEIVGAEAVLTADGYQTFTCCGSTSVVYTMEMSSRVITANPKCKEVSGLGVLARGPIVYCVEQADNAGVDVNALSLSKSPFTQLVRSDMLGGVVTMRVDGSFTALPYYAWNNRSAGWMRTYLPLKDEEFLYGGHTRA